MRLLKLTNAAPIPILDKTAYVNPESIISLTAEIIEPRNKDFKADPLAAAKSLAGGKHEIVLPKTEVHCTKITLGVGLVVFVTESVSEVAEKVAELGMSSKQNNHANGV